MKTILITGANGYLANYIYHEQKDKFNWIRMTRKDADLSKPEDVENFVRSQDFDICVHTAANATTAVCEDQPELAHAINVESTKRIVDVCKEKGARLIFCGTEQEYNGKDNRGPFTEDEPTQSVTVYGQNKMECEAYINQHLDNAIILRFSWMMGLSSDGIQASPSIVKNVMKALLTQTPTKFTCNEKRCLTYAKHLASQFDAIAQLPSGTYHVASFNTYTTYEAAVYIAQQLGASQEAIETYILPNMERYADRFRDYRLDASKIQSYGITLGTFETDVEALLKDFGWNV